MHGTVNYAYGSGTVQVAGIVGRNGDSSQAAKTLSNCYCTTATTYLQYLKNGSNHSAITSGRVAPATMQTYTTVLGSEYAYDVYNINGGYPVLAWQNQTTEMTLNKNQEYIGVGQRLQLNVVENDEVTKKIGNNYQATNFKWKSTNEDVAIVDEYGVVRGVSDGYTTVYAYHEGSGMYAMCVINVARNVANPQIETGNGFTTILKADGTVWTIGNNCNGAIGNGTTDNVKLATKVHIDEDTELNNVVKIATGTDHVLALTKNGNVYAWGLNNNGQLRTRQYN